MLYSWCLRSLRLPAVGLEPCCSTGGQRAVAVARAGSPLARAGEPARRLLGSQASALSLLWAPLSRDGATALARASPGRPSVAGQGTCF